MDSFAEARCLSSHTLCYCLISYYNGGISADGNGNRIAIHGTRGKGKSDGPAFKKHNSRLMETLRNISVIHGNARA